MTIVRRNDEAAWPARARLVGANREESACHAGPHARRAGSGRRRVPGLVPVRLARGAAVDQEPAPLRGEPHHTPGLAHHVASSRARGCAAAVLPTLRAAARWRRSPVTAAAQSRVIPRRPTTASCPAPYCTPGPWPPSRSMGSRERGRPHPTAGSSPATRPNAPVNPAQTRR